MAEELFKIDNGSGSRTVVTTTDTQTLTAKTLSGAALSGTLTAGGSNGTSGQVLKSTGSGVAWGDTIEQTETTIFQNETAVIASFASAGANVAEFTVKVSQRGGLLANKILLLHDGTDTNHTMYGQLSFPTDPYSAGQAWEGIGYSGQNLNGVAYGNGKFVIAASALGGSPYTDQILQSTDSTTWTEAYSFQDDYVAHWVEYLNSAFVFGIGSSTPQTIAKTTDFVSWTTVYNPLVGTQPGHIGYGNGKWVVTGQYSRYSTSTDFITWTTSIDQFETNSMSFNYTPIKYANSLWVAGTRQKIFTSTDATTWTTSASAVFGGGSESVSAIEYANGTWIIGGTYANVATSTDAVTWVTRETNFPHFGGDIAITDVQYGNGLWVATGGSVGITQFAISTDSITWVTGLSGGVIGEQTGFGGILGQTTGVAYGNGTWVATSKDFFGGTGYIHRSPDWPSATIPITYSAAINGANVELRATIADAQTFDAVVKVSKVLVEE